MTYREYVDARQKEVNDLPLFFAFSDAQLEAQLRERNATIKDIYRLGNTGGFYLKKDAELVRAVFSKKSILPDLMKDPEFAVSAFRYEMDNHEYAINYQGDWDVCNCFTEKPCEFEEYKTYKEYLTEDGHAEWIPYYREAKAQHMKFAENW